MAESDQPQRNLLVEKMLAGRGVMVRVGEQRSGTSFHHQPGIEVHITDAGDGTFTIAGAQHPQAPRTALVFDARAPHQLTVADRGSITRTVICFDPAQLPARVDVEWVLRPRAVPLRLSRSMHEQVHRLAEALEREDRLAGTQWQAMVCGLLTQLLVLLHRSAAAGEVPDELELEQAGELVRRCVRFVIEHLDEDLSLERVADAFNISEEHLTRTFRAELGVPFHQFVVRQRLREASRQLRECPDRTLTEISLDVGFGSSAAFSRAFRREMGTSPGSYRRYGGEL